ncbi:MAG: hypothetical protein AAFY28_11620 [Actinomycetota bacterium]
MTALAERTDASRVMSAGYALMAVGVGALAALLDVDMSLAALLAPLFIAGCGLGLCVALIAATAVGPVGPDDAGTASDVNLAARLLGGAIGLAVVTNIFQGADGETDSPPGAFVRDDRRLP